MFRQNKTDIVLEKLRFRSKHVITGQLANDLKFNEYIDRILDRLVYEIETCVWAEEGATEERSLSYPDGWWQHFKYECFPQWLKKKFPVRLKKKTWKVLELHSFPELQHVFPTERAVIKYQISESKDDTCFLKEGDCPEETHDNSN